MVSAVLLGLLLQVSAPSASPALVPGETLLEVASAGEAKAVPDTAEFSAAIVTDETTATSALAANASAAQRLVAAVTSAGIADRDVRTSDLAVRPRYKPDKDGDDSDEIVGYRATNRLTVRVRDVEAVPLLVDGLIAAGANDLSGPSFDFADAGPLRARARADAVSKGRKQAADYAAALGMKVGRVLRISERSARDASGSDMS